MKSRMLVSTPAEVVGGAEVVKGATLVVATDVVAGHTARQTISNQQTTHLYSLVIAGLMLPST